MMSTQYPAYLSKEIVFPTVLSVGSKGIAVRRTQEWLSYHGFKTTIDGSYGPATKRVCQAFQVERGLQSTGKIDQNTWEALLRPLVNAVSDVSDIGNSFGAACLKVAKQHLKQHPLELGGDNCGPWVRTYLNGNDGAEWFWCAGFITFMMTQAALQMGVNKPVAGSVSCDTLSAQASAAGRFVSGNKVANGQVPDNILGSTFIFLVRRSPGDWVHIGLGFDMKGNTFSTIEGNTNDDGSRNGYEVCSRIRSVAGKDFIAIA